MVSADTSTVLAGNGDGTLPEPHFPHCVSAPFRQRTAGGCFFALVWSLPE